MAGCDTPFWERVHTRLSQLISVVDVWRAGNPFRLCPTTQTLTSLLYPYLVLTPSTERANRNLVICESRTMRVRKLGVVTMPDHGRLRRLANSNTVSFSNETYAFVWAKAILSGDQVVSDKEACTPFQKQCVASCSLVRQVPCTTFVAEPGEVWLSQDCVQSDWLSYGLFRRATADQEDT
jgi:hypothetical protein